MKRKTHILIFLAIFKSHLLSKILISEKNPFAQHFIHIKSLIWLHTHPLSKILTNPSTLWSVKTIFGILEKILFIVESEKIVYCGRWHPSSLFSSKSMVKSSIKWGEIYWLLNAQSLQPWLFHMFLVQWISNTGMRYWLLNNCHPPLTS